MDIKYIKDNEGNNFFPVVHEKGVVDDNGTTLESKLQSKQDAISDLATIRSGAAAGATAYQKPGTGIPSTDLASAVQTSLVRADEATVRPYNSENPNGMGYLVLEKDKTFAEQVTTENTIYEIRDVFSLGGVQVQLPDNCILLMNGGTLINGKIRAYNLIIYGNGTKISISRIQVIGEFKCYNCYFEYVVGEETEFIDIRGGADIAGNTFHNFVNCCIQDYQTSLPCCYRDNVFIGDNAYTDTYNNSPVIYSLGNTSCIIKNNVIINHPGIGIKFLAKNIESNTLIDGNYLRNLGFGGIIHNGGIAHNVTISNNYLYNINNGVANKADAENSCVNIHGGNKIIISGNFLESSNGCAFDVHGMNYTQDEHTDIRILNNIVNDTGHSIFWYGGEYLIKDNVFKNIRSTAASSSVFNVSMPKRIVFQGNKIKSNTEIQSNVVFTFNTPSGYDFYTDLILSDNTINYNSQLGYISSSMKYNLTLSRNNFSKNGTGAGAINFQVGNEYYHNLDSKFYAIQVPASGISRPFPMPFRIDGRYYYRNLTITTDNSTSGTVQGAIKKQGSSTMLTIDGAASLFNPYQAVIASGLINDTPTYFTFTSIPANVSYLTILLEMTPIQSS